MTIGTRHLHKLRTWVRNLSGWRLVLAGAIGAGLLMAPLSARGQIGLDPCCAIISAGLSTISGLLKNAVGQPLAQIQQLRQQAADFERQVIYPAAAVSQARQVAGQLEGAMQQMTQISRTAVNSASLPEAQQLERTLLSRDPQQIGGVAQNYAAVFGAVMPAADAPQPVRDLVDMSDAEAQAALKKAIKIDALAEVEIEAARQINQQIESAAPGSAPILDAQAAAWCVRANAYSQSAIAELVRLRSVELANTGADLKLSASSLSDLRKQAGQSLQHTAR
jgi:hypothetical protein